MMKETHQYFLRYRDEHFGQSGVYYTIAISYPDIKGKFAAIRIKLSFDDSVDNIYVVDNINEDVSLLADFMVYQLNDRFYQAEKCCGAFRRFVCNC
ncbi:MAG: hypothetical protein ACLUVM_13685 [Blautia faecis]